MTMDEYVQRRLRARLYSLMMWVVLATIFFAIGTYAIYASISYSGIMMGFLLEITASACACMALCAALDVRDG